MNQKGRKNFTGRAEYSSVQDIGSLAGLINISDILRFYINEFKQFPYFQTKLGSCVKSDALEYLVYSEDWELYTYEATSFLGKEITESKEKIDFTKEDFFLDLKKKGEGFNVLFKNPNIGFVYCSFSDKDIPSSMKFALHNSKEGKELLNHIKDNWIVKNDPKPKINMISKMANSYLPKPFDYEAPEIEDFDKYYENPDRLKGIYNELLDCVNNDKRESSFYIFHGSPGTGKSNFLKYLVKQIKKDVIYVPSHLVYVLAQPEFIDFLHMSAKKSVLVIEDAENVLQEKGNNRSSAMENLLNMTSGFLASAFQMDVICTFNKDIRNFDEAILRTERLNGHYKFKELSYDRAKPLCDEVGVEVPEEGKRTLANIFGSGDDYNDWEDLDSQDTVGFKNQ